MINLPNNNRASEPKTSFLRNFFSNKSLSIIITNSFRNISTYVAIAEDIQSPKASRAESTAIGNNPEAFLIPCHRVIKSSGIIGDYHWGRNRKTAILGWEAAKISSENKSASFGLFHLKLNTLYNI